MKEKNGFTLLEMLITLSIAGILLALALPSFSDRVAAEEVKTYGLDVYRLLNFARSMAVTQRTNVAVCSYKENGGLYKCDQNTDWSNNILAFTDDNSNGVCCDANESVLRVLSKSPKLVTLSSNIELVEFQPTGVAPLSEFKVCPKNTDSFLSSKISINMIGAVMKEDNIDCS